MSEPVVGVWRKAWWAAVAGLASLTACAGCVGFPALAGFRLKGSVDDSSGGRTDVAVGYDPEGGGGGSSSWVHWAIGVAVMLGVLVAVVVAKRAFVAWRAGRSAVE